MNLLPREVGSGLSAGKSLFCHMLNLTHMAEFICLDHQTGTEQMPSERHV